MLNGFRDFLLRGNVVDLAVAVIIGTAFGTVIDGFIKAIVDPLIVLLAPGDTKLLEAVALGPFKVGLLVSVALNFVVKAGVVYFLLVRPFSHMATRLAAAPPPPPADVQLLVEIRDLLKSRK
jgi:large conductance mechanosensitive channel